MRHQIPIRLAIRQDEHCIEAYIAQDGEPQDEWMLIGTIALAPCDQNPEIYNRWEQLMADMMLSILRVALPEAKDIQMRREPIKGGDNA